MAGISHWLPTASGADPRQKGVAPLSNKAPFGALLAEKALDTDGWPTALDAGGAIADIPKASHKDQRPYDYDKEAYQWRHQMENCVARVKEHRGGATRYDKTDSSNAANWNLVGHPSRLKVNPFVHRP